MGVQLASHFGACIGPCYSDVCFFLLKVGELNGYLERENILTGSELWKKNVEVVIYYRLHLLL